MHADQDQTPVFKLQSITNQQVTALVCNESEGKHGYLRVERGEEDKEQYVLGTKKESETRKSSRGHKFQFLSSLSMSAARIRTLTTPPIPYAGTILPIRANELEM